MDDMRFVQAVSRLRTLETKLLDKAKIDRLIDSSSPEEVLKALSETQYGNHMMNLKRPQDYELLLSDELVRLYSLMYEVSPERLLVDVMSLRYDYHNVKVMIKGKALGKDLGYLLIPVGTIPKDKMKLFFEEEYFGDLNPIMRSAIEKGEKALMEQKDPQMMDVIIDKHMFEHMLQIAKDLGEKSIIEFIQMNIDLTNIKAFFRIKKQNKEKDFLETVLVQGGKIDKDYFVSSLNDGAENFAGKMSFTDYSEVVKAGTEELIKSGTLNNVEKLSDNFIMEFIKKSKYISFGPEPLIAYAFAKETEIKTIRIIMVGKLNRVSPELIRERLRDVYA